MPIVTPPFAARRGGKYSVWAHREILEELPKARLEELYFGQKLSTIEIAGLFNVAQSCICSLFKTYGLRTRTLQQAMNLKKKPETRYKRIRKRALNMIGRECAYYGCDDVRLLEIHHKKGGGGRERRGSGGDAFYRNVVMGRRQIDDLEVCCRPCHAVQEIKRLYGVDSFHVVWRGS
jgi:predicted DNA-binding protein YlxM (UPF0122 family)